ncbi:Basic helix-loop-helix motif-containing protein [Phytophthora infestans]|uniref:Basic helix-loop-helix motif-containing protein n=1 Tax=Phytophthora infestans TaxID=4787 RepID=A0A833SSP0_PHYIN|nr:Basic helix-loop-helix motif-containing protein [Phytophthora infestans]KAF4133147.1 Helix-loop-helix DNA-binding domain-containing protein [Phytophthora infestans]
MLQNDYGYSHYQGAAQHHQHSGERPKLFGASLDNGGSANGYHGPGMHDFHQLVHPNNMTPQHHMQQTPQHHAQTPQHQQGEFDHEPIMMNMQHPGQYYAPPPMTAQMLHVSTDYNSGGSAGGATPSNSHAGSKRSREDLNMKEKKRMFKLNDRINQLKTLLDEAGVQSKKNKQSILDNTYHYVGMLRSNLLIAKQKAERAEKQAESFRSQAQGGGPMDAVFKRCFDQSSTPRVVVDLNMQLMAVNSAFLSQTGQTEDSLMDINALRSSLCLDNGKLDAIVQSVSSGMKPISAIVQAHGAGNNIATLTLMASVLTDDGNSVTAIEFSLVPFEISSDFSTPNANSYLNDVKQDMPKEASPSGVSDLAV